MSQVITFEELYSHLNFFFGKSEGVDSVSSLKQIREELEKYIQCTRWIDIYVPTPTLLDGLLRLGYQVICKGEDGDFLVDVDIKKVEKLLLLSSPYTLEPATSLISDPGDFSKSYGLALKDLIEGDESRDGYLFNDEHGPYTTFEHNSFTFKVQLSGNVVCLLPI